MSRRYDPYVLVVVMLLAWQGLAMLVGPDGLASPRVTAQTLAGMFGTETFWHNLAATGEAFCLAVVISLSGGLLLGLFIGLNKFVTELLDPILNVLYAVPKITLYPVVLLVCGLGMSAKVTFGVLHGFFPVTLLTISGVRSIRPVHLKAARALRLSTLQTMRRIVLPAALPEIFTGCRLGIALALLGTLVGEFFSSDRGIGYALTQYVSRNDVPSITALTVLLFTIASLGGLGLLALDRRLHHHSKTGDVS
jgi:NitT/TauT family transport system permease protein